MFRKKVCCLATDELQVCAYTDCLLTSGLHNTEGSKAPAENRGFDVLRNGWILDRLTEDKAPPSLYWCAYSMCKCSLVKAHSLFLGPSRTHTHITRETLGSWGGMPQRSGAACCFYQKVEGEVKNLIPPPPDNYMSLGTVSLSDIPLYITTSHFSGLLTISAIAGDRVCILM